MTLIAALLITPDALIVRLIATDPWTMVFWRGVLIPTTFLVFLGLRNGIGHTWGTLIMSGRDGLGVAISYAVTTTCFMTALHHTSVANTLVILAASPFFSALFSSIVLKEPVPLPTWAAIVAGFAGIAIVMSQGLTLEEVGTQWIGDLAALTASLLLAVIYVLIRRRRHISMVPATALGGYLAAIVAIPFAAPFSLDPQQSLMIGGLCIVLLPICFGLIAVGPRRIPAPEVSLLMLLETVIGPLWVWLFLDEKPTGLAMVGGAIVLGSLATHAAWRMTHARPQLSPHLSA